MAEPVLVLCHTPHCPLGSVAAFLAEAGLAYRQINLYAETPRRLPLRQASGLVVLGGPMSANEVERYPFLVPEANWIHQAVDSQVPTLGICLGAQLLAKALGKRVYANQVKEIGWYHVEILPAAADDRLFGGCQSHETVFQWHGDTFDLPSGATLLARSQLCAHQAFRYGPSAFGVQFHVEMTPEIMAQWFQEPELSSGLDGLGYIDAQAIQALAPRHFPAMDAFSARLLRRFAGLCQRR